MKLEASYGKLRVGVYRARAGELLACAIDIDLSGAAFLPSYTEGDNRAVVATDSLKNFVHAMALEHPGDTLEGLVAFVGRRLTERYAQIERARVRARELPYTRAAPETYLRAGPDAGSAEVEVERGTVVAHRSGREGIELARLSGSSFAGFVRDEHTTLPETEDRPLVLRLDLHWRYARVEDGYADGSPRRVPSAAMRDLAVGAAADFASRSIQHVLHEMGRRALALYDQLDEIALEAENRLWDQVKGGADTRVYADPRPTYGRIALTVAR